MNLNKSKIITASCKFCCLRVIFSAMIHFALLFLLLFLTESKSYSSIWCLWGQKIPELVQSALNRSHCASIVWKQYTLVLIRLGFILTRSLLLSLIKLIYAGRVPAIIHKPLPCACVCKSVFV